MHTLCRSLVYSLGLSIVTSSDPQGTKCGRTDVSSCGGAFFRSGDLSSDRDLQYNANSNAKANVSAIYPSTNTNRVTIEYFSTLSDLVASRLPPAASLLQSANSYDAGYMLNNERFSRRVRTSSTASKKTEYLETDFVCAARSVTIVSVNARLRCLGGLEYIDDADAAVAAQEWCSTKVDDVGYRQMVGGYCGGAREGIFLAFKDSEGEFQLIIYPEPSGTAETAGLKEIKEALAASPSSFKNAASNDRALAIQINQMLFLFGDSDHGGAATDDTKKIRNAINPVAGMNAISAINSSRKAFLLGSVREGMAPSDDWMVGEVVSASYSPCFVSYDVKTSAVVTWGTSAICNAFADSSGSVIAVKDIQSSVKKPAALRVGADVFAAVGDNDVAATWGNRDSGARGVLGFALKKFNSTEPVIAVTAHAVCYQKGDGSSITVGSSDYGGSPSDSEITSILANKVQRVFGFATAFMVVADRGTMATWPGEYAGRYALGATVDSRRYDADFDEPVCTQKQLTAKLVVPCGYSDWEVVSDCIGSRLTRKEQRSIILNPINAQCTSALEQEVACAQPDSTAAPTSPPERPRWSAKDFAGIVAGCLLLVGVLGVLVVLWRGRMRVPSENEGI